MKAGDEVSDVVSDLQFVPTAILLLLKFSISLDGAGSGRATGQAWCFATLLIS